MRETEKIWMNGDLVDWNDARVVPVDEVSVHPDLLGLTHAARLLLNRCYVGTNVRRELALYRAALRSLGVRVAIGLNSQAVRRRLVPVTSSRRQALSGSESQVCRQAAAGHLTKEGKEDAKSAHASVLTRIGGFPRRDCVSGAIREGGFKRCREVKYERLEDVAHPGARRLGHDRKR